MSVTLTTPSTPTTWILRGVVDDQLANIGDSGWYTIQIVAPGGNVAPTATISGPTSLTTGQNGTWNYSASDANANLYRWRLVIAGAPQSWNYISGSSASSSLTMSFASAGTHAVGVEVEDTNGVIGNAVMNVVVSNPPLSSLPYTASSSYASHVYYPSLAPNYTYLTDGLHNTNYGYASDDISPNWLMADFGSTMRITKVHVGGGYLMGWGYGFSYSSGAILQYSNDATNWTTAHTYSGGFSSIGTSITLDIVARYWRLYRAIRMATTEFRFEGTPSGVPTYTVNLVNSQVVPSYESATAPVVREYRALMEKHQPGPPQGFGADGYKMLPYSFVSLEGFLNAKLLVEVLKRMGPSPQRSKQPARFTRQLPSLPCRPSFLAFFLAYSNMPSASWSVQQAAPSSRVLRQKNR